LIIFSLYFCYEIITQCILIKKNLKEISKYEIKIKEAELEQKKLNRKLSDINNLDILKKIGKEKFNLIEKNECIFRDSSKMKYEF
jgi:hypothetical protein